MTGSWRLAALALGLSACAPREIDFQRVNFKSVAVRQSDKDITAPRALIAEIERLYEASRKPPAEGAAEVTIPRSYLALDIEMVPKTPGVLPSPLRFAVPRGGAVINLEDWIPANVGGTFFLRVRARPEGESADFEKGLKVFFVSRSRRRTVSGEDMGAGCGRFMDLSRLYQTSLVSAGLKLNTTDQRHLSALAGTFYFVHITENSLGLATLTFEDPRHSDVLCPTQQASL